MAVGVAAVVLEAITLTQRAVDQVRREVDQVRREVDQVGRELGTKIDQVDAKVDAHRAETDAHRAETREGFDDLDKELTAHAGAHREIEKDIEALKRRPPRTAARSPTRARPR